MKIHRIQIVINIDFKRVNWYRIRNRILNIFRSKDDQVKIHKLPAVSNARFAWFPTALIDGSSVWLEKYDGDLAPDGKFARVAVDHDYDWTKYLPNPINPNRQDPDLAADLAKMFNPNPEDYDTL